MARFVLVEDPVRKHLMGRGCGDHVIDGGLRYLVRGWGFTKLSPFSVRSASTWTGASVTDTCPSCERGTAMTVFGEPDLARVAAAPLHLERDHRRDHARSHQH